MQATVAVVEERCVSLLSFGVMRQGWTEKKTCTSAKGKEETEPKAKGEAARHTS